MLRAPTGQGRDGRTAGQEYISTCSVDTLSGESQRQNDIQANDADESATPSHQQERETEITSQVAVGRGGSTSPRPVRACVRGEPRNQTPESGYVAPLGRLLQDRAHLLSVSPSPPCGRERVSESERARQPDPSGSLHPRRRRPQRPQRCR